MEWRFLIVVLSALIAVQSGCQSLTSNLTTSPVDNIAAKMEAEPQKIAEEPEVQTDPQTEPTRMVAIWRENILQMDGAAPMKGFTGRLYFYNRAGDVIKVDGELNVYGWDDSQQSKERIPDVHFIFQADKFNDHYSASELGHSYSIWVPWEAYGGYRKSITLIPVFKTAANKVVQGSADYLSLSGKARKAETLERTIASPQQQPDWPQNHQLSGPAAQAVAAYHQKQRANSIPIPQSISDQWNRMDMQRLANSRPMAPVNQATMTALNSAEQQSNGSGYNQVNVQRQTQPPMPIYHQMQQTSSNRMIPQSNWTPTTNGVPNHQLPAATNNAFEGTSGVHAALSDMPPAGNSSRVFGKPGTIR